MHENDREKLYRSIGKIYCPYFKETVHFTELGFEHIRFKNRNKSRTIKDQNMRFKLLPNVVRIINLSHTLQGKLYKNRFEERFINNRREIALTQVIYYEFLAIIDDKKIKVIIKEITGKEKVFLSVIPFFKQKTPPIEGDGFS